MAKRCPNQDKSRGAGLRPFLLTALLAGALCSCAGKEKPAPAGNTVDVGGHRLYCELHGRGTPAVVIDVGVGESFEDWTGIVSELSQTTAVLVYDRAGYGRSEAGPPPRDAESEAVELEALLRGMGLAGPFVLVGHSLGGLNAQVFARLFPSEVVGLVLLDPPPRGWLAGEAFLNLKRMFLDATADLKQQAGAAEQSSDGDERLLAPYLRAVAGEQEAMFGSTAGQISETASFGDIPTIVIAAGRANPAFGDEAEPFQKYWIEENRKLASLSKAGEFILADESGHHIHRDAPEMVLAAVRRLMN